MKYLLLLFALILLPFSSYSQLYEQSIGIRSGYTLGITYKTALGNDKAFEGFATAKRGGVGVTGLLELHRDFFDFRQMQWYFGVGAHAGTWLPGARDSSLASNDVPDRYFALGVDGIIGLEYTFDEIPFAISVDYLVPVNLLANTSYWRERSSLSIRYYF